MNHNALTDTRFAFADARADFDDNATWFVTADDRAGRRSAQKVHAFWPTVHMQVAAANAGRLHFQNHLAHAWGGVGKFDEFDFVISSECYATHLRSSVILLSV
jgi:hypothetical protein